MPRRPVTIDPGPWRFSQHPRVLIEHDDPEAGLDLAVALRAAGYAVAICSGPDAAADPATRCPLHQLEPCAVVAGADVVVTALDLDHDEAREVVHGLRTRYPSIPLVVEVSIADAPALENELAGCTVVPRGTDAGRVVAAVMSMVPAAAE
jgi:CheY-like chemotaxis protein